MRTVLELVPLLLDERFQLGKELFDRIEIGRVWRQVQQLDASIATELLDSLTAVERCVVHDEHRARLWIWPAVVEKLLYKVLKHSAVSRALEDPRQQYPLLCVCRQYLVPSVSMEPGDLHRRYSQRRPACAPEADPFIAPRLVDVYELVRAELG